MRRMSNKIVHTKEPALEHERQTRNAWRPMPMIRLIVSDIDGVWTDGRIGYVEDHAEIKQFNVRDGLGVKLAQKSGIVVAVLTSRRSAAVTRRCQELGIEEVIQGAHDKHRELLDLAQRLQVPLSDVCYVGDDLPDIAPMKACGMSAAPRDAVSEVLDVATLRLATDGGHGALRELVERVLKSEGRWTSAIDGFLP